jgi:hypothetical protein
MAGTGGAQRALALAMFAREYLSVVSRWARQQLREGAETSAERRQLKQLIEAADALRAGLPLVREAPENVVELDAFRRRAS